MSGVSDGFGDIITTITMVVAIVVSVWFPPAMAYVAAAQSLINSAVNGFSWGKRWNWRPCSLSRRRICLLYLRRAGVSGPSQGRAGKSGYPSFGQRGLALIMGATGDDIWRTAAAGAVAGLAGIIPGGTANQIFARVMLAAALNVAAARIEGVKEGDNFVDRRAGRRVGGVVGGDGKVGDRAERQL